MDAIPDKIALAKSWGLRIASGGPSRDGWWTCIAIDDDHRPSAGINEDSGVYRDNRSGQVVSLFDLAVALGAYSTWLDALDDLGARYLGT